MLGGLAVIASDTAGQREIAADTNDAVRLYRAGDPLSLSIEMNRLLASPEVLKAAQTASLNAAKTRYNWEIEEVRLQKIVTDVVSPAASSRR